MEPFALATSVALASEITTQESNLRQSVGAARFPDLSPVRKLESWCESVFGRLLFARRAAPILNLLGPPRRVVQPAGENP
jgi:hypothetical protein